MKKNILMLINGFGVEQPGSYDIYSADLMPNMDKLVKEKLFSSLSTLDLDYKAGYRNFSIGVREPLAYSIVENKIKALEYKENQHLKYIISQVAQLKSKLHIICYWDNDKTIDQLITYIKEIQLYPDIDLYVHFVLTQRSMNDYKNIESGFTRLSFELTKKLKIGVVTGEETFNKLLTCKDFIKTFVSGAGEKWTDIEKKITVLNQTKCFPYNARTFVMDETFRLANNDQILFFNYSNVDITLFKKELLTQTVTTYDYNTIKYYSLFPIKSDENVPFMYNFAVSSTYALNSLKSIGAKALIMDEKDKCSQINYYMTGLRNTVDPDLKYVSTDDGFIYEPDRLIETIKQYPQELIIINYEIDTCKKVEEIEDRLRKIDAVIGKLDEYVNQNNSMCLMISSLYGIEKELFNEKHQLCRINFSVRVPILVDDKEYSKSGYSLAEGSTYDLSQTIFKNINIGYNCNSLIRKKSNLLSFLYKKPKKEETK